MLKVNVPKVLLGPVGLTGVYGIIFRGMRICDNLEMFPACWGVLLNMVRDIEFNIFILYSRLNISLLKL